MKIFLSSWLAIFAFCNSNMSFAGTEGHGGGGVMCTSPESGEVTVELLDFWVGRNHGLVIPTTNNVILEVQLEAAIEKIHSSKGSRKDALGGIRSIMKRAQLVDTDDFPLPHDTGNISLPAHCKLIGIVNYKDYPNNPFRKEKITVNSRTYPLLSNTDQAGLWLHEYAFSLWRQHYYGALDSTRAQRTTAIAFSTEDRDTLKWPRPRSP